MDYVPNRRADRKQWLENLRDNVEAEAVKMGVSVPDGVAAKALAVGIITKFEATDAAAAALDGARTTERMTEKTNIAGLRAYVRNWKTLPLYAGSGSDGVLALTGSDAEFDPATYKPVIVATIEAGKVKIAFEKLGVDSLAIYSRLRGQTAWHKLGTDSYTPYFDTAPLAQAGVAEVREYMARGMVGDEEIGLDSDIVSVTFGG